MDFKNAEVLFLTKNLDKSFSILNLGMEKKAVQSRPHLCYSLNWQTALNLVGVN